MNLRDRFKKRPHFRVQRMRGWLWIGVIILIFSFSLKAHAFAVKLKKFDHLESQVENWKVENPKIVIAFGMLEQNLVQHYSNFVKNFVQEKLKKLNPAFELEVIEYAQSHDIVGALKDSNTVGFILVSHTYTTRRTHYAVALSSSGHSLPVNLLSAATPSLRFVSFLGCNGLGIFKEYEVEWAFEHLPGHHTFYYSPTKYLSADFLKIDQVKKLLKKIVKDLETQFDPSWLWNGKLADHSGDGKMTLSVKDVYAGIEPRFVSVNGRLVGVLGSSTFNSNQNKDYQELTFSIPSLVWESKRDCHKVKIVGADLTPGVLVDNYLIRSVILEGPFGKRQRHYDPPWHFGDQDGPPLGTKAQQESIGVIQVPKKRDLRRKKIQKQLMETLRTMEWMDTDPEVWKYSPLKDRFYMDCI